MRPELLRAIEALKEHFSEQEKAYQDSLLDAFRPGSEQAELVEYHICHHLRVVLEAVQGRIFPPIPEHEVEPVEGCTCFWCLEFGDQIDPDTCQKQKLVDERSRRSQGFN